MRKSYLVSLLLTAFLLTGCPQKAHERAFEVLAASGGFIRQAQVNHPECEPGLPPDNPLIVQFGPAESNNICRAIYQAIDVHNAALDALDLYCAGPGWVNGGECNPPKTDREQLRSRLEAALNNLDQIIASLKGVL